MEKNRENFIGKDDSDKNLMLDLYGSMIKDGIEKKIVELIIKNVSHEEMLNQLLSKRE